MIKFKSLLNHWLLALTLTVGFSPLATAQPAKLESCQKRLVASSFPNERADNQEEEDFLRENSYLLDRLNRELTPGGPLSLAQKLAIARYTMTYERQESIIVNGAKKLPPKAGVYYRGEPQNVSAEDLGRVIQWPVFRSVSASRYVAEGFLNPSEPMQLVIINSKTARDISEYSQGMSDGGIPEEEALILPGTKLRIDKIYPGQFEGVDEDSGEDRIYPLQVVELSEIQ